MKTPSTIGEQEGECSLAKLRDLIRGNDLIVAPVVCNPIMARMAEDAGFKAIYLSGGTLGWVKCVTEANLTLPEMAEVAVDIRAACKLPLVLDAGGGWGDPVHVHRTIALAEAAGFAAIEIEDQLLPRRVEHHVGIDHLVPTEFFLKKLKEAIAARRRHRGGDPSRRSICEGRRRHGVLFHPQSGRGAHGGRAGAAAADDVRAGRWLRHLTAVAAGLCGAWVPAGGLLRHGLCCDVQGGAAIL